MASLWRFRLRSLRSIAPLLASRPASLASPFSLSWHSAPQANPHLDRPWAQLWNGSRSSLGESFWLGLAWRWRQARQHPKPAHPDPLKPERTVRSAIVPLSSPGLSKVSTSVSVSGFLGDFQGPNVDLGWNAPCFLEGYLRGVGGVMKVFKPFKKTVIAGFSALLLWCPEAQQI
jgi:hypothetical protein